MSLLYRGVSKKMDLIQGGQIKPKGDKKEIVPLIDGTK